MYTGISLINDYEFMNELLLSRTKILQNITKHSILENCVLKYTYIIQTYGRIIFTECSVQQVHTKMARIINQRPYYSISANEPTFTDQSGQYIIF